MEQFLSAPGALTRAMRALQDRQGDKAAATKPLLIAEAEAFALYLNPPAPPQQRKPAPARPRTARPQPKPVKSTPKWLLQQSPSPNFHATTWARGASISVTRGRLGGRWQCRYARPEEGILPCLE